MDPRQVAERLDELSPGDLEEVELEEPANPADARWDALSCYAVTHAEGFLSEKDADFSFGWGDKARFRANVFVQQGAIPIAMVRQVLFREAEAPTR